MTAIPRSSGTLNERARPRRSANVERVLEALRVDGPSSQAQLARRTGISPATVNSIVRDLRTQGFAEIRPINGREGFVALITGTGTFVTIEVANDWIHGAAFVFDTQLRFDRKVTGSSDVETALAVIEELATAAGRTVDELDGLAVAIQAPIEKATGAIARWCNGRMPGWAGVDLGHVFSMVNDTVIVENDANLAALAEWTWGAGRGVEDFAFVRSSEGVGGGVIIDGKIYHGGNGMAGDFGHVSLEGSGEVCYCGSRGCLTTLISERAIVEAVRASPGNKSTLVQVIAAARHGDAACQRVLAESGTYLGRALANAAKVLAPAMFVVGGELGTAGPLVFDALMSSVEMSNLRASTESTIFVPGAIGIDGALLGAVALLLGAIGNGVSELDDWMKLAA